MSGTLVKTLPKSLVKTMGISFEKNPSSASGEKVYAIIYGSPTENPAGVFSDFSNTNYLLINQQIPEEATELQIEFTQPSTIATSGTQAIINAGVFSISMYQKAISFYSGSGTNSIIPSTDATPNSTYRIKLMINGKVITHCYSKDGGEFTTPETWTSNLNYSNNIRIGNSTVSGRGWKGSINMNNTYIKIGSKFWYDGATKNEE